MFAPSIPAHVLIDTQVVYGQMANPQYWNDRKAGEGEMEAKNPRRVAMVMYLEAHPLRELN